jgi:hypothetical protein
MTAKRLVLLSNLFALVAFVLGGCSGGQITIDEAYAVLRPVKQLELPDQIEDNLVISISNVADQGSSYKNTVSLYVNDKEILPNWLISNVENTFTYRLKVKPGYYDIKARYYAYVGWGEEKFDIVSQELIKVTHDRRTLVSCHIAKQQSGEPVNKRLYFKSESETLDTK